MPAFLDRRSVLAALALLSIAGRAGYAPAAAGERPLLIVSGKIAGNEEVRFGRAELEALGTASFTTTTPWYKEKVTFEGVPLARLMEALGATGDRIVAVALNEYSAEVPMEDLRRYGVLLALKRDGEYMPVSDKGPLFIVYPFDSAPELKSQKFYARSVWQVARLEVE
jgi:hypothetical protein